MKLPNSQKLSPVAGIPFVLFGWLLLAGLNSIIKEEDSVDDELKKFRYRPLINIDHTSDAFQNADPKVREDLRRYDVLRRQGWTHEKAMQVVPSTAPIFNSQAAANILERAKWRYRSVLGTTGKTQ